MDGQLDLTTVATVGVLSLLVIDRVLTALKTRGIDLQMMSRQIESLPEMRKKIDRISTETHELHQWHDQTDRDGVKVWYVRQSLEEAISHLSETMTQMMLVLQKIDRRLETIEKK